MSTTVTKDVLTVTGPDAQQFLHSLVSQDVASLEPGTTRWSFLLQPQGKVVGFFTIARTAPSSAEDGASDTFELVLDAGSGAAVRDALQRYLIRTKATLALAEAVERPGLSEVERINSGLPRWGREITESTIPNETGLTPLAVSFTKGCYVGQELVERIDSRGGNVPKRLCLLRLDGTVVPPDGAARLVRGGRDVGTVTSAALDPDTGSVVALGYVRREVADGERVDVLWGTDGSAEAAGGDGASDTASDSSSDSAGDTATVAPLPAAAAGDAPTMPPGVGRPRFGSGRP
jgi:folate-binding protein YgfZ